VIDDVHLAPRLIHHLGRLLAQQPLPPASYVLVGCRPVLLAAAADEAFSGRAPLIRLDGLSHAEASAARPDLPLAERLLRGGFPALHADAEPDIAGFMRDLVADHLVRDLPEQLRVDSVHAFERFLRAAALRSGRILNKAELARAVGIAGSTAAIWLDTLVEAGIISLLRPASTPQGRGLVKAPKLQFLDTGLCSHLLGIRTADELAASPHAPAVWEADVHREVRRLAAAAAWTGKASRTQSTIASLQSTRSMARVCADIQEYSGSYAARSAATSVTSLLYLVPPTTAAMAWLLFDEPVTAATVAGIALTAVGRPADADAAARRAVELDGRLGAEPGDRGPAAASPLVARGATILREIAAAHPEADEPLAELAAAWARRGAGPLARMAAVSGDR
jgi:hypothetical protein